MRHLLLCFLLGVTVASAQRPWIRQSTTSPGPNGKLSLTYNTLYYYDSVALQSYDRGATWIETTGLRGRVCTIDEFTQGVSVAVCYDSATSTATGFFTTGGAPWTEFRSINGSARPVRLTAINDTWYVATDGPVIYVGNETLDSIRLPGSARAIDMVAVGDVLVVNTTTGVYFTSTTSPVEWSLIAQDGLGVLYVRNDVVYAASVRGVKRLDLTAKRAVDVGSWKLPTPPPVSLDLVSHQGSLLTITRDGNAYQAYRLEGDTSWKEVAYPLPGKIATVTRSVMAMDAGWMVLSHQITEGFVDSAGVYAFDLNDFTSVNDNELASNASWIKAVDRGGDILLHRATAEPARVVVTDLHGRTLYDGRLDARGTTSIVPVATSIRGFIGITLVTDAGSILRTQLIR